MTKDFGTIKSVDIKDIWKNEPHDFTPWLADNLDVLGQLIGLDLELISCEADAGDFRLDILAQDLDTNGMVIIENQFDSTDHKHLGQLITYASYYKAGVVIWVAEEIREEHRAAIDWLNNITDDTVGFFAVEINVIRIDDSKPALNFKLKAFPNEWRKSAAKPGTGESSSTMVLYQKFFQTLIDELRTIHKFTNKNNAQPRRRCLFPSGIKGISYAVAFVEGIELRVTIVIAKGKAENNKRIFRELEKQKQDIEKEFGDSLKWEILEDKRPSRIAIYRQISIKDNATTLDEIKDWCIDRLLKFKEVFEQRLKATTDKIAATNMQFDASEEDAE